MSVGDHLEDLRKRMILGLIGFVVGAAICLALGKDVILPAFTWPCTRAMIRCNITPQFVYTEPSQPFMVYMEISMICGAVLASPWLIYQLWQFVAAGLYANERKVVTKYLPLSIGLLLFGWITLYFLVLPVSLEFFFRFGSSLPLSPMSTTTSIDTKAPTTAPTLLPNYHGNPPGPYQEGQAWIDEDRMRWNVFLKGELHGIDLKPIQLTAPMITLPQYIDMVVNMLIAFGLSFQLPLVVMALVRVGIIEIDFLKKMRKYVYFVIACVAAVIIPDVVTGWFMLMIPLFGLYELGILLAARSARARAAEEKGF
jgi:sec-independent protein translocase protein TatC